MVRKLPQEDKDAIAQAIIQAERKTRAELVCVVAPASDPYQQYVFLYGFLASSLLNIGLWLEKIVTAYPMLLAIQLGIMATVSLIPYLRYLCMLMVPATIRHRRAAHRAFEEYVLVARHVPINTPIVLLYISIAERYAHILPSRAVRDHIADTSWKSIIDKMTDAAPNIGLRDASIDAIRQAALLLSMHFPKS